jgi:choline dehydrogenase-like flavoprotein
MTETPRFDFDYVIIGSAFGGSVAALRLTEKGYRVLVMEKGKQIADSDFAASSWDLARRYSPLVGGEPAVLLQEALLWLPTTARRVLGGAVMGSDASEGVIDAQNRVFGCAAMYVCDGSMISANLGVNPALTILALAERAMG